MVCVWVAGVPRVVAVGQLEAWQLPHILTEISKRSSPGGATV